MAERGNRCRWVGRSSTPIASSSTIPPPVSGCNSSRLSHPTCEKSLSFSTKAPAPPPDSGTPRPLTRRDDLATRRTLMLFAVSLIVVGLGGFVAVTFGSGGNDKGTVSQAPTSATTTLVKGAVIIKEMGPGLDEDLAPYLAARAKDLANAKGDRIAVISFRRYVTESEARSLSAGTTVTNLLAALPGGSPSVVTGSIGDWLNAQFSATRDERDQIRQLLPTVEDPQFQADYKARIDELDKIINAVDPNQPLVFGVVVRAPVSSLKALAKSAGVRLVDVGPSGAAAPDAVFRGLRPEETTSANAPPSRPA